ncbi:SAM-dependent methyltransferase [Micromonospora aurantiaca]|uniref:SAM-dependent methyltransferase n=1 Tax=Micromonospora aurantiaca (nom. illeg.) TaxID=47850 RepID=UPI0037B8F095
MASPQGSASTVAPRDSERLVRREILGLDRASAGRVEDFLLGGGHNFAVDRTVARQILQVHPDLRAIAIQGRAFLLRAVRLLAADGISQFLVLGSSLPLVGSVHEMATRTTRGVRVVYVEAEPVALTFTATAVSGVSGVGVIAEAPDQPVVALDTAVRAQMLDIAHPVAVVMAGLAPVLPGEPIAQQVCADLRKRLSRGSCLVVAHAVASGDRLRTAQTAEICQRAGIPLVLRSPATTAAMLAGFELMAPGFVSVNRWHPDDEGELAPPVPFLGCIAVKR